MAEMKRQRETRLQLLEKTTGKENELVDYLKKIRLNAEMKKLTVFLTLLGIAVAGRVALQWVPSVEPIIPIAIVAGIILGMKEGFMLGGSAYVISNFFVWGLQGPWTIFQAIGAAIGGALGGVYGKARPVPKVKELILLSVIATAFYEVIMNVSGAVMGIGMLGFGLLAIPLYFLTSLPFSLTHIISNCFFAAASKPLLKLKRWDDEAKVISVARVKPDGSRTDVRLYKSD